MKKWITLLLATMVILSCKTKKNAMQNASEDDSIKIENSDGKDKIDEGYPSKI
jgi:hypothetical protein